MEITIARDSKVGKIPDEINIKKLQFKNQLQSVCHHREV